MGIYFELSAYNNLLEDGLQIWEQEEVDIKKEIFLYRLHLVPIFGVHLLIREQEEVDIKKEIFFASIS